MYSPHWLVSWQDTYSPFKNMGLWEFCFSRFRYPNYQFDDLFDGCHYVFSKTYFVIWEWLLPGKKKMFCTAFIHFVNLCCLQKVGWWQYKPSWLWPWSSPVRPTLLPQCCWFAGHWTSHSVTSGKSFQCAASWMDWSPSVSSYQWLCLVANAGDAIGCSIPISTTSPGPTLLPSSPCSSEWARQLVSIS